MHAQAGEAKPATLQHRFGIELSVSGATERPSVVVVSGVRGYEG